MIDIFIESKRKTSIACSIFNGGDNSPLLMMAHGFKSDRSEDNRFYDLANKLAENGISSICMDFVGTGDSDEDFSLYSLDTCLDDLEVCYEYMLNNYSIDNKHMALLGYSMGGRIISLFNEKHREFNNLVFWAAYNDLVSIDDYFLKQSIKELKKQVDEKGTCDFYNIFDEVFEVLSGDFINNLLDYDALSCLNDFKGNALIIQGNKDITIPLDSYKKIYDNLNHTNYKELIIINGADHGFGLWDNRIKDSEELVEKSFEFLLKNLKENYCD